MIKVAKRKKPKPKLMSKQQFSARLRRISEDIARSYNLLLPTGDLVSQKYVTTSVGLKLTEFKPKAKIGNKPHYSGYPEYKDAERYYNYTCTVLWLYHPYLESGSVHKYSEIDYHDLKKANEKKVLERLK